MIVLVGIERIITFCGGCWIGLADETTVAVVGVLGVVAGRMVCVTFPPTTI